MIGNFDEFLNENYSVNEDDSEQISITSLLKSTRYKNIKQLGGEILWDSKNQQNWLDKGVLTVQFETHKILPSEARYSKLKKEFPDFDFKAEENKIYKYIIETESNRIIEISQAGKRLEFMNRNVTDGRVLDPVGRGRPYTSLDTQFKIEKALLAIAEGMKDIIDRVYWDLFKEKTMPKTNNNKRSL
jgi:hypothetical protein